MTALALRLAYDGTAYQGWNVQPGRPTVQGTLASRLARLTPGVEPRLLGAARTDTGVHAIEQIAAWTNAPPVDPARLVRACHKLLPADVRLWGAAEVPAGWDPRRACAHRTYRYHFTLARPLSPFLARFVVGLSPRLDTDRMGAAAATIEGVDIDMKSFAAHLEPGDDAPAPRHVVRSRIGRDGDVWYFEVAATGFLHHAVRRMVGTLVDVGRGRLAPEAFAEIARGGDGRRAGQTMPPQGLFLCRAVLDDAPAFPRAAPPWTPVGPYNP